MHHSSTSLIVALASLSGAAVVDVQPGDPSIRHLGRTIEANTPGNIQWSWSGSGASITFTGTSCSIRMSAPGAFFRVKVDGKETATLDLTGKNDTIHTLATNLPQGTHTVEARLRTEANNSVTQFHGFRIDGTPGTATPGSSRRIEYYGNSITCGYGILDSIASNPFALKTEDEGRTYAALAADSVGAERHNICWSGKGVIQNYNRDTLNPTIPKLYNRVVPSDSTHLWDFTKWVPQVVVIDLGTNDFSHVVPDSVRFHRTFLAFLDTLHAKYPQAKFILLDGPMLSDGYPAGLNALTRFCKHMDNIMAAGMAKGLSVSRLSLTPQDGNRGYGADFHPNQAQAKLNGQELTSHLRKVMDWSGISTGSSARPPVGRTRIVPMDGGYAAWTPTGGNAFAARLVDSKGRTLHSFQLAAGSVTALPASNKTTWLQIETSAGTQILAVPPKLD